MYRLGLLLTPTCINRKKKHESLISLKKPTESFREYFLLQDILGMKYFHRKYDLKLWYI